MSANEDVVVKNKKYDLVPPDGGWGYAICVSSTLIFSVTTMFLSCFGIIFKEFLKELEIDSTTVTLMNGINIMCLALAGFLTNTLLKMLGLRKLAFLASFLFNLGAFCTIFVRSTVLFIICQGFIQYAGFGILYNLGCTLINDYFLKRRLLATSIVQTLTGACGMVAPLIVKWSLERYGYRGTLVVISVISMLTFVAVALMQPVDKHMVKVEVQGEFADEMKLLGGEKNKTDQVTTPIITLSDPLNSVENNIKSINEEKDVEKGNDSKSNFSTIFNSLMDVSLIKKFLLSTSSMGPTYSVFAESLYALMLPQALYAMGWDQDKVAFAVTLCCFGDLFARVLLILLNKWLVKIGNNEVYLTGLFIALLSRLGMLWSDNTYSVMVFVTLLGVARCTVMVLTPLIFAESYPADQFTSVMGIYMLIVGLMNLIVGPAFGAIRDATNSYSTVFYILSTCFAVVILLWCIELLYKRNKHKRILQREQAEKLKKQRNRRKK